MLTLGLGRSRGGLPVDLPGILAALTQIVVAGGALALLRGAGDRGTRAGPARVRGFALAALTGFGHLGH